MTNKVNFGHVANDYAQYRDELPSIIFEQLKERNVEFQGKIVIDLGSGSGIFSRAMASQGAYVTGVEPELNLITQAAARDKTAGIHIDYVHANAEEVTLTSNHVDLVAALRAWHWFDRQIMNEQVMKWLKATGYLVVIHSIFVPSLSRAAQETIRAIREFNKDLKPAGSMGDVKERRTGFPIHWFEEWTEIGFQIVDEWQHDYTLTYTLDDWCGKVKSLSWLTNESEERKEMITAKVKEYLQCEQDPMPIPHTYSVVVLKK